jgi:hypothetical protein
MSHRSVVLYCLIALSIALLVGPASAQRIHTGQGMSEARVEEIELLPGVTVPVDIWPDDYVPTVEDFISIGFDESDAQEQATQDCTWGQIKACYAGYYNECCPKKVQEG